MCEIDVRIFLLTGLRDPKWIAASAAELKFAKDIDPSFWFTEYQLFVNARSKRDQAGAVEHLARAHELRDEPEAAGFVRAEFARGGWMGFMLEAVARPDRTKMGSYVLVSFATELGEKNKAFALLSDAYDRFDQFLFFLKIDPPSNRSAATPRYNEMLKKLGFPE